MSSTGTHFISESEVNGFAEHISSKLANDRGLVSSGKIPIRPPSRLFQVLQDGVVLCKLINVLKPGIVDVKYLKDSPKNKFEVLINHRLVFSACFQLGLNIVNIDASDLMSDSPDRQYLKLALIWQLLRFDLMSKVNVVVHPEMSCLIEKGEPQDHFVRLPAEITLLRWVNFHLAAAGSPKRIYNFGSDVTDSEAYTVLLHQLDPSRCSLTPLKEQDLLRRADLMLQNADRLGCRKFLDPSAIVSGNEKLNLAFVATLFNEHSGLVSSNVSATEAKQIEELSKAKLAREEEEFHRRMELERARFAQQMEEESQRMKTQLQHDWSQEEDAKRRFLEEEARKIATEKKALELERTRLESQQREFAARMTQQQPQQQPVRPLVTSSAPQPTIPPPGYPPPPYYYFPPRGSYPPAFYPPPYLPPGPPPYFWRYPEAELSPVRRRSRCNGSSSPVYRSGC